MSYPEASISTGHTVGSSATRSPRYFKGLVLEAIIAGALFAAGVMVVAPSMAGAAWPVDTTAPTTPADFSGVPSAYTTLTGATIGFSLGESGGTVECRLDIADWAACTSVDGTSGSFSVSDLGEGSHSVGVRQTDASDNTSEVGTSGSWTVDLTAPSVPDLSGAPASRTNSTGASISFSGEAGASFTCSVDGGEYSACGDSPKALSELVDGAHSLDVKQTDLAGNTSAAASASWTVDATAPVAPRLRGAPSGSTRETSASIEFLGEDTASFTCSVDEGVYGACVSSPVELSSLSEGSHSLSVKQTDAAGNTSSAASVSWSVDTTAPGAPNVTSPTSADTVSGADVPFAATSDGAVAFACKVDGGEWLPCPVGVGGAGDGSTITVGGDTLLHWGEASTDELILLGLNQGSGPEWFTSSANFFGRSFTETEFFAYLLGEGSVLNLRCGETVGFLGQIGGDLALGVVPSELDGAVTKYNTFRLDCSSTLAEVGAGSPAVFKGLAEGAHTLSVKAFDLAGNASGVTDVAWTVVPADTTAPDAPVLTGAPASRTNSTSASIGFSGEDGATFTCSVDGGAYSACGDSPKALSELEDGVHSLAVKATDAAGNTSTAASASWTVDTASPDAPGLSGAPAELTKSTSASIGFSGESSAVFTCSVDGGEYSACGDSPKALSELVDGAHSLDVKQTDLAGNVSAAATASWTVDATAPVAPRLRGAPSGRTNKTSASIEFLGEDTASFTCSVDEGVYGACVSSPVELSSLGEGSHSLSVKQTDAAGNTSSAASVSWSVDTTAPGAPNVTSPTSADTVSGADVPFAATSDGAVAFACKVDGGKWWPCPVGVSGAGDGSMIDVGWTTHLHWGEDSDWSSMWWGQINPGGGLQWNGNWQREWFTQYVGTDVITTQSYIGLASLAVGQNLSCSYIQGIAESPGIYLVAATADKSKYSSYRVDCANQLAEVPSPSPAVFKGLAEGAHTLSVKAFDLAGNASGVTDVAWTVVPADTTAPDAPVLTGAPASRTNSTSASIGFSGEDGATFTCSVDGGAYSACGDSPKALSDLEDGVHSLAVKATDAAGNTSTAASASWTVDTASPDAPGLSGAPAELTKSTGASIGFSGEAGASFSCSVDEGAYAACGSSPRVFSSLADGDHSLSVKQTDLAGNVSAAATASWTVDATVPVAPRLTGAPSASTNETSASIDFSGEVDASFTCSVDGADYGDCASSPVALSSLGEGSHSVAVKQTDQAGNTSAAATASWIVDVTAPDAPGVELNRSGVTNLRSASASLSGETNGAFECKLDSGKWVACSSPKVFGLLPYGAHRFYARQVDAAGNVSTVASSSWTISALSVTRGVDLSVSEGATVGFGTTLSASGFAYSGQSTGVGQVTYQWQRCSNKSVLSCVNSGVSSTLRLTESDVGSRVRLRQTFTSSDGVSVSSTTGMTGVVVPVAVGEPIVGLPDSLAAPAYGRSLTGTGVEWSGFDGKPASSLIRRQWQRCTSAVASSCVSIPGATSLVYVPSTVDVSRRLRLLDGVALGVGLNQVIAWASSPLTGVVTNTAKNTVAPVIKFKPGYTAPKRLVTLTSSTGSWSYTWLGGYSYQWQVCSTDSPSSCESLAGQTRSIYAPATSTVGKRLRVVVKYTGHDRTAVTAASAITAPVQR